MNSSEHHHRLVASAKDDAVSYTAPHAQQPAVRFGLYLVRALTTGGIAQVLSARKANGPFESTSIEALVAHSGLERRNQALARIP